MLNLGWLFYVPGVVYLGFNLFPWWTPLVAGIGGTALYCLKPKARYAIGSELYGYDNQPNSFGRAVADLLIGKNPSGAAGLFKLLLSLYLTYVFVAFVLFGIGWGVSIIL